MTNTQELLIKRNKELVAKNEELEKKNNQKAFIGKMIEEGDKYRMGLRGDNPWWNNERDYYSTERCNFTEILFGSGNPCSSDLEPFVWNLITSHCQFERFSVQRSYFLSKLSKEKDELTSEVANLTESLNHWKPRAEDAEQKVKELEVELEEADVIIDCHEAALMKAKEWRERNEKELKEEIDNQADAVYKYTKKLAEKVVEVKNLKKELIEEREKSLKNGKKLTEESARRKELQYKLYLANKPLPKTPSKFKILKEKVKIKLQNLAEKAKHQSKELITRIEVKVK